jgi:hypothetical protein
MRYAGQTPLLAPWALHSLGERHLASDGGHKPPAPRRRDGRRPCPDPLVAPGSQRRVRDFAVDDIRAGDHRRRGRKQCRHRVPDSIDHLWIQRAAARSQLSRRRTAPASTRHPGTPNVTLVGALDKHTSDPASPPARRSVRVAVGDPVAAAHTERHADDVTGDRGARAATRRALGTGLAWPYAGHPSFRRRSGGLSFPTS